MVTIPSYLSDDLCGECFEHAEFDDEYENYLITVNLYNYAKNND